MSPHDPETPAPGVGVHTEETAARAGIVAALARLDALGMNRGSTGNLSLRWLHAGRPGMLITPTGMGAGMRAQDLVWLGEDGERISRWLPSSEWPFHQAIYRTRPGLNAIVHTHSVHATALACLERRLPPFHYMVALAGGDDVPCTAYHTFGSEALSQAVAQAMASRDACLMAHHGLVAAGSTLAGAMKLTLELESLCETYLKALAIAEPPLLDAAQMAAVSQKFHHYGQPQGAADTGAPAD